MRLLRWLDHERRAAAKRFEQLFDVVPLAFGNVDQRKVADGGTWTVQHEEVREPRQRHCVMSGWTDLPEVVQR
jgi:hypothetical protein